MKYYIPIHRDNVDNVITAESIAPADVYPQRGYGYSYFKILKEVPSRRSVSLFERPLAVSDVDEVELIVNIEIDSKHLEAYNKKTFEGGVYVTEPIAFLPWNCRFLFTSEEALRQAMVICRSSLSNKAWEYFDFDLVEGEKAEKTKIAGELAENELTPSAPKEMELAAAKNRLKGFAYAYVMGRYSSLSQQLASLIQTERRMYDIAATMTGLQRYEQERFATQLLEYEAVFEKYDPNRTELQKRWREMIESRIAGDENRQAFDFIVKELGGEEVMKNNFARKIGIELKPRTNAAMVSYMDWNDYKKELEDYTMQHVMAFRIRKGDVNTKDDFAIDGLNVRMNEKYGRYYGLLITMIVEGTDWLSTENLRLHRLDVASELTRMVRDMKQESGQEWEGSEERIYLNNLRQHIATGEAFDLQATQDITLKSLAIFILKGDDFEEMMRYVEYNAIADYRFVMGLWGACKGYADMPKTAVQRMRLDYQGTAKIYMESHRLVDDVPEDAALTLHQYQFRKKEEHPEPQPISHVLLQVMNDKTIGLTKAQKTTLFEVWQACKGKMDKEFFDKVKKIKGIGPVKMKKLKETLAPATEERKPEPDLFSQAPKGNGKRLGMEAWLEIEPLLPNDTDVRNRVKSDFNWFVGHSRRTESNRQLIENYKKHLNQKAHPTNPKYGWTATYFGGLDIDKIIARLEEIYL